MKMPNNKAFTLIEVLISVVILAIVGTGLLQISTNSKQNFSYLKEKNQFSKLASIPLVHNSSKYHNKDTNLYFFLEDSYDNIDDDLRKYLKEKKIHYSQEEFTTSSPFQDENSTQENNSFGLDLTLIYDKITISNRQNSTYAFKIYIPTGVQ